MKGRETTELTKYACWQSGSKAHSKKCKLHGSLQRKHHQHQQHYQHWWRMRGLKERKFGDFSVQKKKQELQKEVVF